MGQTTGELRQAVDSKRDDAAQKIDQIEQRVGDSAQQMKETFNWRRQVDDNPLVAVGAAIVGGMVLGGVLGGDGDNHQSKQPPQWQTAASGAGLAGAVRKAAKSSGIEDSFNEMASNLFGSISNRMKQMSSEKFPSIVGKSDQESPRTSTQAPRPAGSSFAG